MPTPTKPPQRPSLNRPDPDEDAWRAAWATAEAHNRTALERYHADAAQAMRALRSGSAKKVRVALPQLREAPPLPDFTAASSDFVTRECLGRYAHDRDSGLVHDTRRAGPDCALDLRPNLTFVHWGGELDAYLPDGVTAHDCMSEEA